MENHDKTWNQARVYTPSSYYEVIEYNVVGSI